MTVRLVHNVKDVLRKMRATPKEVLAHVDPVLARGAQKIARSAKSGAPKAFSTLTNSIRAEKLSELVHQIVAGTNYARAVEEGTGPGVFPSIQSIRDWMQVKGISGDAGAIAKSIAKKGTPAKPYMGPSYDEHIPKINRGVVAAVRRGMAEAVR